MNGAAIAGLVVEIIGGLMPIIHDLVTRGLAGEDITHDDLWQRLPHETRTAIAAKIMQAQREALGLPV